MNKHLSIIFLLLLCLLVSSPAEARLSLGVVSGSDPASGEITLEQARSLAIELAEKLQEEVVVKELADSATLVNWLERFAMLDLALLPAAEVKASPGRFLIVGQFGEQGEINLVARQGVGGDLPQRVSRIVRESDFAFSRPTTSLTAEERVEERVEQAEPASIDEVIAAQVELEHVPALSPGRVWTPQDESAYQDILPTDKLPAKKLVLGVFPAPDGLLRTSLQVEQLAAYIEQALPVSTKVREFASTEAFAEWFMRFRMVDLAVLPPSAAKDYLGSDYLPVAKLLRADKPGVELFELVVMRRGQNKELQQPLQDMLLDLSKTTDGQVLLAALNIREVVAPEGVAGQALVVVSVAEPFVEREKLPVSPAEEIIDERPPQKPEYAEPEQPLAPPEIVVKSLPILPQTTGPVTLLPQPELPAVVAGLPVPALMPVAPVSPVTAPALPLLPSEPLQADVQLLMKAPVPAVPPELPAVVEVVAAQQVSVPVVVELPSPPAAAPEVVSPPLLLQVPEQVVTLLQLPAMVVPGTVESPAVSEVPEAPVAVAEPVAIPSVPASAEVEIAAEPPVIVAITAPEVVALPDAVKAEAPAVAAETVIPVSLPVVSSSEVETIAVPADGAVAFAAEEKKILEEVMPTADLLPRDELAERHPAIIDKNMLTDDEFKAMLGADLVASVVAQPDIPQQLRPSGIPIVRPGKLPRRTTVTGDNLLVASIPGPLKRSEPARPPQLLPAPDPEPGIVYVLPFVAVMVPAEVDNRVFDQFVDLLNQEGAALGLQFVILKEGLQRVDPQWLAIRKYVTGEIYAYVEDSGCCSTDLRTKARLTYRHPSQETPAFGFEYPVKSFFDHDRSSIAVERIKLADNIAVTLAKELLKVLKN